MQADNILRTTENGEEIWYSQEYILRQMELAFQSGIANGIRVEMLMIEPASEDSAERCASIFWEKVNTEYKKQFDLGHVWRIAGKRELKPKY